MAKELATKAGVSAAESLLRSFMPELFSRLERIERRFDTIEKRLEDLGRIIEGLRIEFKEELYAKTEQTRDVINEVGGRVLEVRTRVDSYIEIAGSQSSRVDNLIERVVKVEMMQSSKRRKAS